MLSRRRLTLITSFTTASMLGLVTPAFADNGWGNTTCEQMPTPACDLDAGTPGNGGAAPNAPENGHRNPGSPDGPGSGNGGAGNDDDSSGGGMVGEDPNPTHCSYVPSDYRPPPSGATPVSYRPPQREGERGAIRSVGFSQPAAVQSSQPGPGAEGSWYVWKCTGQGAVDALYRPPVWIPNGQTPGEQGSLPSPAELAQVAREQLSLPKPVIASSPVGPQLVNLPTWLWLAEGWRRMSATASVPGVSVTAVASPESVSWSMGDGATVTCTGPGTPFRAGTDPRSASPDCGHTYRRSSAHQPGGAYAVEATVHWTVTWSGAGQSGTFPDLTSTAATRMRVAESQALNTGG